MFNRKLQVLAVTLSSATFAFTTCSTNMRDALIGGALDWVSGSTSDVLSAVFPLLLSGATDDVSSASDAR
ncbi:MAG: hypothetical protein JNG88_02575 [Phycisphaerales bacterium]|nr:hypothetical protein [Phycisphaerales bacterium]